MPRDSASKRAQMSFVERFRQRKRMLRQRQSDEAARLRDKAVANQKRDTWLMRPAKNKSHRDLIRIVIEAEFLDSDIIKFFIGIPREKKGRLEKLAGEMGESNVFITAIKVGALDKLEALLFEFGKGFAEKYFIHGRVPPDAETVFHVIFRQDYRPESRYRVLSILSDINPEGIKSIIHLGTRSNPDKTVANLLQQPQHCTLQSDPDLHRLVARELEKWMYPGFQPRLQFVEKCFENTINESHPVEPQDPDSAGSAAGHELGAQLIQIVDSTNDVYQADSTQTSVPKLDKVDKGLIAREKWLTRTSGKTHKDLKKIVTSANFSERDIHTFFDTIPIHRREDAIACLGKPAEKNIFLVAAKLGNLCKLNALVLFFRNSVDVDLHRYFFQGRGIKGQTILFYAVNRAFAEEIRIEMVNLCKEILQGDMFTLSTIKARKPELCAFELVKPWTETNLTLRKILDDGRFNPRISMLPKRPSPRVQPDESIRERGAEPFQINVEESFSQFQSQQAPHDPREGLYPREVGEQVDDSKANRLGRVLGRIFELPGASPSEVTTHHPGATSSTHSYSSDSANSASSSSDSASSSSDSSKPFGSTTSDEAVSTWIVDSTHKQDDVSASEEGLRDLAKTLAERCEGVQMQNESLVAEIAALRDMAALLITEKSNVVHKSSLTC